MINPSSLAFLVGINPWWRACRSLRLWMKRSIRMLPRNLPRSLNEETRSKKYVCCDGEMKKWILIEISRGTQWMKKRYVKNLYAIPRCASVTGVETLSAFMARIVGLHTKTRPKCEHVTFGKHKEGLHCTYSIYLMAFYQDSRPLYQ